MMRLELSFDELGQIALSMVVVALAFSVRYLFISKEQFIFYFPVALMAVGSGFVFHELAHKFMAMRYGAYARFRVWESGLAFALIVSLITRGAFVFAAPGAVYIYSQSLTRKQNGIISIAGPLTNLAIGMIALLVTMLSPGGYIGLLAASTASINFFLGFFNMLPVPPLDGSKVLSWNLFAWLALTIVLAIPTFIL